MDLMCDDEYMFGAINNLSSWWNLQQYLRETILLFSSSYESILTVGFGCYRNLKTSFPTPDSNIKLKQMCKNQETNIHHQNKIYPSTKSPALGKTNVHSFISLFYTPKRIDSHSSLTCGCFKVQRGQWRKKRDLEVPGVVSTLPLGPFLFYPPAQNLLHVGPVVEPAELHQLAHRPLTIPEQELQGGALWPLFQETQFIIGHAPFACKIPPVFYCWVTWIQLYPDHV